MCRMFVKITRRFCLKIVGLKVDFPHGKNMKNTGSEEGWFIDC